VQITLGELARMVKGGLIGDPHIVIRGAAGLEDASEGDITFLETTRFIPALLRSSASAVVVREGVNSLPLPMIHVRDPEASFAAIAEVFRHPPDTLPPGVHPSAVIADNARIGEGAAVGPHVTILDGARIGKNVMIYPGVYIGYRARIGDDCVLHPGAAVLDRVVVGRRVVLHPGAVLGADGFGYRNEEGAWRKIPHLGTVVVEDDVEIGANVTVDRARYDKTCIGAGTKIDNLVHVGHNVKIGPHCLLVAQAGVAGSVNVGREVILAGQSGVERHVKIGDRARVAGKAGVTHDIPAAFTVAGFPAQDRTRWLRGEAALRKLPGLLREIRALDRRVKSLEHGTDDHPTTR